MTALSLASVLAEAARRYPDKTAVVDGPQRIAYADLWRQARSYAAGLQQLGVRPNGTVAMAVPNVEEMAYVLRDSKADVLVCHTLVLGTAAKAAQLAGIPLVTVGPAGSSDA